MTNINELRMVSLVSCWCGMELTADQIYRICDIMKLSTPNASYASKDDVKNLIRLMKQGNQKIEAIRAYRQLTGAGLQEAKDTVEDYWPTATFTALEVKQ